MKKRKGSKRNNPARPESAAPVKLKKLAGTLRHPSVLRTGLTTTEKGAWALLVEVKMGASYPIKEIEEACEFPIIYQEDSGHLPIARPAYPMQGE